MNEVPHLVDHRDLRRRTGPAHPLDLLAKSPDPFENGDIRNTQNPPDRAKAHALEIELQRPTSDPVSHPVPRTARIFAAARLAQPTLNLTDKPRLRPDLRTAFRTMHHIPPLSHSTRDVAKNQPEGYNVSKAVSSRPTVLTKYPLAQKCWPTKLRRRSP